MTENEEIEFLTFRESLFLEGEGHYVGYGIVAVNKSTRKELLRIPDVSTNEVFVKDLAGRLTRCGASLLQLYDIIEDELP